MTKTIYETYSEEICSNCKNRDKCQEELRKKIDNTIRCDKYERENQLCKLHEKKM